MKLNSDVLLGTKSVFIPKVGKVRSPRLREFMCDYESGGLLPDYHTYRTLLSIAVANAEDTFELFGVKDKEWWDSQSDEWKRSQNILTLINSNLLKSIATHSYKEALNYFFEDEVQWLEDDNCYVFYNGMVNDQNEEELVITGVLTSDNLDMVIGTIAQMNSIDLSTVVEEKPKEFKSNRIKELFEKIQKGKKEMEKTKMKKDTEMYQIPNLISSLVAQNGGITYLNVFDLTVNQLFDMVRKIQKLKHIDIRARNMSVWGSKDKNDTFNPSIEWLS